MSRDPDDPQNTFQTLDAVIAQMQADEAADAPLISPVNYAKLRSRVTPQLVYYRIRTGKLKTYICNCGRRCIKIAEADEIFFPKSDPKSDEELERENEDK